MHRTIFLLLLVAASGCTRVTVHKDPRPGDKGFRYYRPKPYLMITPGAIEVADEPAFTTTSETTQSAPLKIESPAAASHPVYQNRGDIKQAAYQIPGDQQEDVPVPERLVRPQEDDPNTSEPGAANDSDVATSAGSRERPVQANIALMYMPDFSEEYSVRLHPGLGSGELSLQLDNGWNLTSVGMKTDQQTDEIINSVANLVGSVGDVAGAAAAHGGNAKKIATVLATNIPFGMYEAVIANDPCGRKQLYGWRYVGFMPFQACPVCPSGMQRLTCNDPNAIYGLVMDNTGTMRFEKIAEIPYMKQQIDTIEFAETQSE